MSNAGRLVDGRYVLGPVLGQGGMGVVYRAHHQFTGAEVALKVLHPQFGADAEVAARFGAEARAPAAINHPGIARVTDAGRTPEGELYLVMELLVGDTLRARLARERPTIEQATRVAAGMLDALSAAHAAHVIHRDLKPENVILASPDDAVKILDFGIAKIANPVSISKGGGITATGSMMGTVEYMSPEQIRDSAAVDHRTDLWATAVILYECLTGQVPFPGSSHPEVVVNVLSRPATAPSQLAEGLGAFDPFFARAFAPDPQARFGSAAEMLHALRAFSGVDALAGPARALSAGAAPRISVRPPRSASQPPGPATLSALRSRPPPPGPAAESPPLYPAVRLDEPPRPRPRRSSTRRWVNVGAGVVAVIAMICVLVAVFTSDHVVAEDARTLCDRACHDLARCAHVTVSACVSECQRGTALRATAQQGRRDCRSVLGASLELSCSRQPAGRASCRDALTCDQRCAARGGSVEACHCNCLHELSPDRAADYASVELCTTAFCSQDCRVRPNASRCGACLAQRCKGPEDSCRLR